MWLATRGSVRAQSRILNKTRERDEREREGEREQGNIERLQVMEIWIEEGEI